MLTREYQAGRLDSIRLARLESTLVDLSNAQGGMERIGTDLQSPFRFSEHQIQMDTICETIERNLESMQREAQCGELVS